MAGFGGLRDALPPERRAAFAGFAEYAERHRALIARSGRFPHRDIELGRPSTPEERAFIDQGRRC